MARKKQPAQPQKPDVLRGCLDCADKDTVLTKKPCKECVRWSLWQISPEATKRKADNQAAIEAVKKGKHNTTPAPKPRRGRARRTST